MTTTLYPESELQMNTNFILCIEEIDTNNLRFPIDTRLFIGWDENNRDFFIRGKRQDTLRSSYVPFAFNSDSSRDLFDIIKFIVGDNNINIILYNFNNTYDKEIDELTYEFFEEQMNSNYEIGGYNDLKYTRKSMVRCLKMLRNSYTWDNNQQLMEESGY
jgi:hypothetical protein